MNDAHTTEELEAWIARFAEDPVRAACITCDCYQGFLTQLELDYPAMATAIAPLKVPSSRMHPCLGCDPCPPGGMFAAYLRVKNVSGSKG